MLQPARAASVPAARGAARLPSASETLDWAEWMFPHIFPSHEVDQLSGPYTYRHYPATDHYLGIAGDRVYLMGPYTAGQLQDVGSLWDYACAVIPQACSSEVTGLATPISGTSLWESRYLSFFTPGSGYPGIWEEYPQDLTLSLRVTGDLALLGAGDAIRVFIEDPAGLLREHAVSATGSDGRSFSIKLTPRTAEGYKSGKLRINVCLDADCQRRPAQSTFSVSYRYVGISHTLRAVGPYAYATQMGTPRTFTTTFALPSYTTSWSATTSLPASAATVSRSSDTSGTATLSIRLPATEVGTWPGSWGFGSVGVTMNISPPVGAPVTWTAAAVSYSVKVVQPSPPEYFCFEPNQAFTLRRGESYSINQGCAAGSSDSYLSGFPTVEYLTWPAGAEANASHNDWIRYGWAYAGSLPSGTYTARYRYRTVDYGVEGSYFINVTMRVE